MKGGLLRLERFVPPTSLRRLHTFWDLSPKTRTLTYQGLSRLSQKSDFGLKPVM